MGPWQHNIEMSAPPQPAARSLRTKELSRVFCAVLDPDATPLGGYPQSGAYRPWMPVDVRDDAFCHVSMLESTKVKTGERCGYVKLTLATLLECPSASLVTSR